MVVGIEFQRMRAACGGSPPKLGGELIGPMTHDWTHLRELESESIYILRETVAQFRNPVLLYSVGKDSSVLVHLARKAFYPGPLPFPFSTLIRVTSSKRCSNSATGLPSRLEPGSSCIAMKTQSRRARTRSSWASRAAAAN